MSRIVLKSFPASPRMAVRVVTVAGRSEVYQVQYEVAPGNWRNLQRAGGSFFHDTLAGAKAAALRCHARNN